MQKVDPDRFRPYDLKVIFKSENQKELVLDEYYTISAQGIVHVYTDRYKKRQLKLDGKEDHTSTEVISLSDWMHESTLFNIITNIEFFKSYAITKIFNIWKANVRYRSFCKTRKKLVYDCFVAKPAFAQHLLTLNKHLYELQMNKTISSKINENRTWEKADFKEDQENTRKTATKQYEAIVNEQMATVVKNVCNEVNEKCNMKESEDGEDTRFGQQVKQRPMHLIRFEG